MTNDHACPQCGSALHFAPENHEYTLIDVIYWCESCRVYFEEQDLAHYEAVQEFWRRLRQHDAGQMTLPGLEVTP